MTPTEPTFALELPEGHLAVHDLVAGPVDPEAPVVLAAHGITANGLSWQRVADELGRRRPGAVRVLAPDLRGRAASADAAGPYGLGVHADDLAAVASAFAARPVLVGHSMGGFVTALAAARYPDRFGGVVLVDGGLAFPAPADLDVDAALAAVLGPAMERLSMRFADEDEYLAFWDAHPAIGPVLRGPAGEAVRRYVLHDLVAAGGADRGDADAGSAEDAGAGWRSSCVLDAVRQDGADVLADPEAHAAARVAVGHGLPVELVWAHRGLQDEPQGLYDDGRLAALDLPDALRTTGVDTNHYAVILEEEAVAAVADAVERVLDAG
ncbi:alpha/beta fold hydrolase [Phycicoccus sp. BSK3Z-2]|uniref:Alpha/beta fold hydrolase n=1 Tax=Phycicoccus avicenniae TaxID=2828860 RepID=A0A941D8A4_9MICO|nr:alpha/beta fold hydrolase [Phycicoccus avicenniae]MBR7743954.1 alpha/beta fold hydrolase [Phycicoccus avicenniae]